MGRPRSRGSAGGQRPQLAQEAEDVVALVTVFAVVVWLLRYGYRTAGQVEPTREVLDELWRGEFGEPAGTDTTAGQ